jgi:glycosyltransferase involved in cell wall biosynthesis
MRILTALTFYHPHWTGLTAHAVTVAEGLAARGHGVTVLTTRHNASLARDETIKGVRVIRLQPVARVSRGMVTPAFPHAAARLIGQHDVVHIHTPFPEAPLMGLFCRAIGRPVLMTHHGDIVMPTGPFNRFVEWSAFWLLRCAGELAAGVTSYSRDYAAHSPLLRSLGDKVSYVYPPVDMPPPDVAAVDALRHELGLDGHRLIGFAGRWVEEKGFDDLLRALPLIRRHEPEAHLVYAGDPHVAYENFYERCQPLIRDQREHITCLGLIRDVRRMAAFYAMCDVFALPSRSDMMALVQIEALLCGTPVVATDIPGARVVIGETGMGRLAPPSDPAGLADAIVEVLANRARYRADRARTAAIFDAERALNQYEELLHSILQRLPAPAPAAEAPRPRGAPRA